MFKKFLRRPQNILANAFFTAGQVIFEVPTGIIADTYGRRTSYLLGALTLSVSTFLYLLMWQIHGPFWGWAASSVLLGLGYTFFSGATEAWLVDALKATNFKGHLEGVFAFFLMRDLGFVPSKSKQPLKEMKNIFKKSVDHGLRNPPVRWIMLAAPFTTGVSFYIFYALQPFLLELYGDEKAYSVAGLIAAIVAVSNIAGGIIAPKIRKLFSRRTTALILGIFFTGLILVFVSLINNFWIALILIFLWGLLFAALMPIRQAYLNGLIPSEQRATVLSFDSLLGSSGGVVIQPALGKAADVWNYPTSYALASLFEFVALPFIYLARRQKNKADIVEK
ncbi:MAG: MFS transporter [Candidatus Levybacteria bacterium]|nr:MFS transporter [Candidatus Levybacteria bacterium]